MELANTSQQTMAATRVDRRLGASGQPARFWTGWSFGWFEAAFLVLLLLALGMRLWELGGRAMHYDEAIHAHYAWRLANSEGALGGWPWVFGRDYIHAPWMHGPFQIEITALVFRIFSDSDFTARLVYVLFGTGLVGLPYFLRNYLGRGGALLAGVTLGLSPTMLYFSRFGHYDILMAFWTTALLVLMWRYFTEGKHRYLYLASAVLAFMFATKETAYIVVFILGGLTLLLGVPQLAPWALGRIRLSQLAGPAGFLLLLVTLTLPQWTPLVSFAQEALGLTLASRQEVAGGLVGAPHWAEPFVALPIYQATWWLHAAAAALLTGVLLWISARQRKRPNPPQAGQPKPERFEGPSTSPPVRQSLRQRDTGIAAFISPFGVSAGSLAVGVAVPLAAVAATCIAVFRPIGQAWASIGAEAADFAVAGLVAGAGVGALSLAKHPWRKSALLLLVPALLAAVYVSLFTDVVNVDSVVHSILPTGIAVDVSANAIPVNYLVAGGVLLAAIILSVYLGVGWLGGRWLVCAGIFYGIWITLYTTLFTNLAGAFSGVWQGMGYWIAQQDVARGNQPWYYYFVGLSIYELLPVIFGAVGAVYFLKKGDVLGLALAFWAGATLLAYTVASEKMPWLLVNVSLPFILLASKCLGDLAERVRWREALRRGQVLLLLLPPLAVAAAVYLLFSYVNPVRSFSSLHWALLFSAALAAATSAYLVRLAGARNGVALAALGVAALLLGFGTLAGLRAAYTFDDSNQEMLVYAQGGKDLRDTFRDLDRRIFRGQTLQGAVGAVKVDYDLWYPFAWYVRQEAKDGSLTFSCFKDNGEDGWNAGCNRVPEAPDAQAFLLTMTHGGRDAAALERYQRNGPFPSLLWFYEGSYRRPGENRQTEGFNEELAKDFRYFKSVATDRHSWFGALDYLIFRNLKGAWFKSEFYSYLPPE
jgi:predicted membrane-bound mannosyltransferase